MNWKYPCIVFLVFAGCLFSSDFQLLAGGPDVLTVYDYLTKYDRFNCLNMILLGSVFAISYCVDDHENYHTFIIHRCACAEVYAASKYIVNMIAVFFAYMGGITLYMLFWHYCLGVPWIDSEAFYLDSGFYGIFWNDWTLKHPIAAIHLFASLMGLLLALMTSVGLLLSAWVQDWFVALTGPVLIYFFYNCISFYLPMVFELRGYGESNYIFDGMSQRFNYIWKMAVMLILLILFGFIFIIRVKRRWLGNADNS